MTNLLRLLFIVSLTLAAAATAGAACVGDCSGDGMVRVVEADLCGDINRGGAPLSRCPACDPNGDGEVSEDEFSQARDNYVNGCPAEPTATRTRTPTGNSAATPTRTPTSAASGCVGDCNGDGSVGGEEPDLCDRIARGESDLEVCPACDGNHDGIVSFAEKDQAAMNEEQGCPAGLPTATRTATRTPTTGDPTATRTATATSAAVATATRTASPAPTSTADETPATPTPTASPTPTDVPVVSSLESEIATDAELIPLADVSGFPPSGVVQIGDELIAYSGIQLDAAISASAGGVAGIVRGSLIVAERGYMGTEVQAHAPGTSVTLVPQTPPCPGDCNDNHIVSIDELIRGVNIALGTSAPETCPAFDTNADQQVTVSELIAAVNATLNGCP